MPISPVPVYSARTWASHDVVAYSDLNRVEQGILTHNTALIDTMNRLQVLYPLSYFGAKGDNSTLDDVNIASALTSGLPLDWGDSSKIYLISAGLSLTLSKHTYWRSMGAQIKVSGAASAFQRALYIDSAGYDFTIGGEGLYINGNRKAFTGLYVNNTTDTFANLLLNRLWVSDCFRADNTFTGGDGIYIQGSFERIGLIRPAIKNITMAAGAHTVGVQGVTGITVKSASTTRYFHDLMIDTPQVWNVFSESLTDYSDQDGIRVMAAEDAVDGTGNLTYKTPYDSHFTIRDYTSHNNGGRALKSQAELGFLRGATIIRDRVRMQADGVTPLAAGQGTDIDFQVGGGIVEDVYCKYVGDAPNIAINMTGPATGMQTTGVTAEKIVPHPIIKNIRVVTDGTTYVQYVLQKSFRAELSSVTEISNVEAVGTAPACMMNISGVNTGKHEIYIDHLIGSASLAGSLQGWIRAATDGWTGHIYLKQCQNTSGTAIRMIGCPSTNVMPNVLVSAEDCTGFNDTLQKALDAARNVEGPITRMHAFGPKEVLKSGVFRPTANTLADATTWKLPASFLTNYTGMLLVSVDGDIQGQGIFAVNQTTVTQLVGGTTFAVGTTSDPATSGKLTLWTSSTGPSVGNHTGASHTITVMMIG